jgi:WD40 repeat protein
MSARPRALVVAFCLSLSSVMVAPGAPAPDGRPKPPSKRGAGPADRYGDSLPPGATARLGTVRLRHAAAVTCLAYSSDGTVLASGGEDRVVRLWDADTGEELREGVQVPGHVSSVLFTPDGRTLVTADWSPRHRSVTAWNVADGTERRSFPGVTTAACLALSADGKTLAAVEPIGAIQLWDFETGEPIRRLCEEDGKHIRCIAFSPDGAALAVGDAGSAIRLWDWAAGKERAALDADKGGVDSLSFSPDGRTLAASGDDGAVTLWVVREGKAARRLKEATNGAGCAAFSPDGAALATARSGTVHVWDPETGKETRQFPADPGGVYCLAFSPDGKRLATAGADHVIRVWDLASGKPAHPFASEPGGGVDAHFTSDGRRLALRHGGGAPGEPGSAVRFWEVGAALPPSPSGCADCRTALARISPDGNVVAEHGAEDGTVRLLEAASGKELRRFGRENEVCTWPEAFSPDGTALAVERFDSAFIRVLSGVGRYRVRLLAAASGELLVELDRPANEESVVALGFSPDGKLLALAGPPPRSTRCAVSVWDAKTGKEIPFPVDEPTHGSFFAFFPDGRWLAVGGDARGWVDQLADPGPKDDGIFVRELLTGKTALRLAAPPGQTCCCVSPDGGLLAAGDEAGVVRLYDLDDLKEVRELTGHRGRVCSLSFSPDGKWLASGSADTTVLVWDVAGDAPSRRPGGKGPTAEQLTALWDDLAGADASRAYAAARALTRSPEEAVPFLRERLRPVRRPEPARLARLIRDLDSDEFEERERASRELGEWQEAAGPALDQALPGGPSAEARARIEDLLGRLARRALTPERAREARAVASLERMGTAESRRLLESLAEGVDAVRLTQEAKAALERQPRRPNP